MMRSTLGVRILFLFAAAFMLGVAGGDVRAEPTGPPTMKSLLEDGFEVKSTVLIPTDAATRVAKQSTPDAILFTLQRGPRIAFCYATVIGVTGGRFIDDPCYSGQ